MDEREASFLVSDVDARFEAQAREYDRSLNIALVGKVSSGKSSLLNALLGRSRADMIVKVDAPSGTTRHLQAVVLDERVRLIDSPGLDDIKQENSDLTRKFLNHIDVALVVVTGSADAVQRRQVAELHERGARVFVVLNKIDQWDRMPGAIPRIVEQWRSALGVGSIYQTCAFGYDPNTPPEASLDIRGVDQLRADIELFLDSQGKGILLARHLRNKESACVKIIATATAAVAVESFTPGAGVLVASTQLAALYALHYLYTGKILSKKGAWGIMTAFLGQTAATQALILLKSLLPPTGIADLAAAAAAVSITLGMLAAFASLAASGAEAYEREQLAGRFAVFRGRFRSALENSDSSQWGKQSFWATLVRRIMFE